MRLGPINLSAGGVAFSASILVHVALVAGTIWAIVAFDIHLPFGDGSSEASLLDQAEKPDADAGSPGEGSLQFGWSSPQLPSGGSMSTMEQAQRDMDVPIAQQMASNLADPPADLPDEAEDQPLPSLATVTGAGEATDGAAR